MNSARRINVAVVGLGFMGVTHLRAYQHNPIARIVAVCGASRLPVNGILPGLAGNIGQPEDIHLGTQIKVYRAFEEMLADENIELVDICTPTPLHHAQAITALRAGKHVLCEKPMARTSGHAREILKAAETARGFFMPAMCMRFWPGWSGLDAMVKQKTYGKILAARFRRMSEMPAWSRGTYGGAADPGGALFDLHIHDTDFVNFLFGRPTGVFSNGVINAAGSIDHVVTQYHFPDGSAVHAEGSWLLTKGFNMAFTLLCERATVDFDLARGKDALQITEPGQAARTISIAGADGYSKEIRYFVDCIVKRERPSLVTAGDGVTALEICEAEEKSLRTDALVKL